MQQIRIWAPPHISDESIIEKINEWMERNPIKPPYERFIQDYISSIWPVLWHLTTEYKINIDARQSSMSIDEQSQSLEHELCSICHYKLDMSIFRLGCSHAFHSMCIHTWLQRANTCPMCRAIIPT